MTHPTKPSDMPQAGSVFGQLVKGRRHSTMGRGWSKQQSRWGVKLLLHLLTSDLSYMLKIARQKLDKHKRPSKLVRYCTVDLIGLYNVHLCCQSTSGETFSTYYVLLSPILNIWIWRTDKSGIIHPDFLLWFIQIPTWYICRTSRQIVYTLAMVH